MMIIKLKLNRPVIKLCHQTMITDLLPFQDLLIAKQSSNYQLLLL